MAVTEKTHIFCIAHGCLDRRYLSPRAVPTCFLCPLLKEGSIALVTIYVPTTFVSSTSRRSLTSLHVAGSQHNVVCL